MKQLFIGLAILSLSITTIACGQTNNDGNEKQDSNEMINDKDNTQNHNQVDNQSEKDTNNSIADEPGIMRQKMDDLDYTDFELEVDYGNDQEYEAEIEQSKDNHPIKADLEDELNGVDINGEEAFNAIYPNVKKLTIDQGTEKDKAIKETLDAFDLPGDYVKFELELTFKDGTKIEFEDKK